MVKKDRPVAQFAPAIRNIKLYADGRIDYLGKSGSVIGATARIERSGEKRRFRDMRKVVLRIDGPGVAIAASLPVNGWQIHRQAEEFLAQVNEVSNEIDRSARAPAIQSAPDPPGTINQSTPPDISVPAAASTDGSTLLSIDVLIGLLERLGKLRDSGVLTEDEFQAQKTAVLRARQKS